MKTDIFLLLLPLYFHLIYWYGTGEKEALFEHSAHSASLCSKTLSKQCHVRGLSRRGSIGKRSGYRDGYSLTETWLWICSQEYLSSLHFFIFFYTRADWTRPRSQTASKSSALLRRMGCDWWSNMFSIQLCCHTWATRNKQSFLPDREKEREGSEGRERERGWERRSGWVLMPESAMNLTCFPDLIYVNSTCRLWDKAFNTSDCNFMAYLLWKYFDGKSYSVFLSNNIPALHRWGFCKADLQIVKFSPAPFIAGNYVPLQEKHFISKRGG